MGHTPPTLAYAARPRHSRLRKWTRRLLLAILLLACLYAAPLAWLYWGWKQEQPAREMLMRQGGSEDTSPVGPAFLNGILPARLQWIRVRVTGAMLPPLVDTTAGDNVRTLHRLHQLETLYLQQATDSDLAQLGGMEKLRTLLLGGAPVTDAGLVHLSRLAGLRGVYLNGTQITDGGLVHLKGLTSLQELDLGGTRVTTEGVVDLQKALPNCRVISLFATRGSSRSPASPD